MKLDLCKKGMHCSIWVASGQDHHVHACAHCKTPLGKPWFSSPGDDHRAALSARSHVKNCVRLKPSSRSSAADRAIAKHFRR